MVQWKLTRQCIIIIFNFNGGISPQLILFGGFLQLSLAKTEDLQSCLYRKYLYPQISLVSADCESKYQ